MSAFGHTELTTNELPDELQFRVDTEPGWFPPLLFVLLCFALPLVAWKASPPGDRLVLSLLALGFAVFMGFVTATKWENVATTKLSVTSQNIVATGNFTGSFLSNSQKTITVQVSEVRKIGYQMGGEDTPSGLYVSCGFFKNKCVLPGLNRQQAKAVTEAIQRRFPEIGTKKLRKG